MAKSLRLNERIQSREVLLIGDEGQRLGVMPLTKALQIARERGLDVVEVAPTASPPVCRILDYGKFKYEQAKKERESRKSQKNVVVREVRVRPKIDEHDVEFKTRLIGKLLSEGDKVKVTVLFRGREITHPQLGKGVLDKIATSLREVASLERMPSMEGRSMFMIMTPGKPAKIKEVVKESKGAKTKDTQGS